MGHLTDKNLYRKLGAKIDNLTVRAPWNDRLYAILKELYSSDEAIVAIQMPYGLATFEQISKATAFDKARLQNILNNLSSKGLVMDIWFGGDNIIICSPPW